MRNVHGFSSRRRAASDLSFQLTAGVYVAPSSRAPLKGISGICQRQDQPGSRKEADMLSAHLIRTIEMHAEELTRELLDDLGRNPRTPSFHSLTREELRSRVYDVYHNLG